MIFRKPLFALSSVSRGFLLTAFFAFFIGLTPVPTSGQTRRGGGAANLPDNAPNIVIFLIDTLRADHLGAYGYKRRATSPRIDELAGEAVLFEKAYAPAPWTLPTVASLMTSTFPCEHGTLDDSYMLEKRLLTLAQRLQHMGYATLGFTANAYFGEDFETSRGFSVVQQGAVATGKDIQDMLDTYPREPFLLYIHNVEPHTPHRYAPPKTEGFDDVPIEKRIEIDTNYDSYRSLTRADFFDEKPLGTTDNTVQQQLRMAALTELKKEYVELYDAAIRLADQHVGETIDLLKKRGAWDNTIFILVADHGEEMNEHGGWLHDQSVYEELIHVPLLIRFPDGQYGGRRVDRVVSLIDVMPTLFDYLGKPRYNQNARGESLMPLVRGDSDLPEEDFRVISMRLNSKKYFKPWKQQRGDVNIVVRKGKWKAIWNVEVETLELYDLDADPFEKLNVKKKNSQLALVMQLFASEYYNRCISRALTPDRRSLKGDDRLMERLRSLGYVD